MWTSSDAIRLVRSVPKHLDIEIWPRLLGEGERKGGWKRGRERGRVEEREGGREGGRDGREREGGDREGG